MLSVQLVPGIRDQMNQTQPPFPCVSVYLSRKNPASTSALSPRIRLVRLLKSAEKLLSSEFDRDFVRKIMEPLWQVEIDKMFQGGDSSLGLFRSPEFAGYIEIPQDAPELAVVSRSFHLKPVINWVQSDRDYYFVTLTRDHVQLFRGNASELTSLKTIERETNEPNPGARNSRRNGGGRTVGSVTHSHEKREVVRRFFQEAAGQIHAITGRDRLPILVGGVGYLHSIFRRSFKDPDVVMHRVLGNPQKLSERDILRESRKVMSRILEGHKEQAVEEFMNLKASGKGVDDLATIAKMASQGRVQKLMIAHDRQIWGILNPTSGKLVLHPFQMSSRDEDILDDLAELVLNKGGRVLSMAASEMPGSSPAAATLRW